VLEELLAVGPHAALMLEVITEFMPRCGWEVAFPAAAVLVAVAAAAAAATEVIIRIQYFRCGDDPEWTEESEV
jgi:hypothetical protein